MPILRIVSCNEEPQTGPLVTASFIYSRQHDALTTRSPQLHPAHARLGALRFLAKQPSRLVISLIRFVLLFFCCAVVVVGGGGGGGGGAAVDSINLPLLSGSVFIIVMGTCTFYQHYCCWSLVYILVLITHNSCW